MGIDISCPQLKSVAKQAMNPKAFFGELKRRHVYRVVRWICLNSSPN